MIAGRLGWIRKFTTNLLVLSANNDWFDVQRSQFVNIFFCQNAFRQAICPSYVLYAAFDIASFWGHIWITGPAKIDHLSTKNRQCFHFCSIILFILQQENLHHYCRIQCAFFCSYGIGYYVLNRRYSSDENISWCNLRSHDAICPSYVLYVVFDIASFLGPHLHYYLWLNLQKSTI